MIAPTEPKTSGDKENISAPQRLGIKPPTTEPMVAKIQIKVFEFIFLLF